MAADRASELELALVEETVAVAVGLSEHGVEDPRLEHVASELRQALGLEKLDDTGRGELPVSIFGIDYSDGV